MNEWVWKGVSSFVTYEENLLNIMKEKIVNRNLLEKELLKNLWDLFYKRCVLWDWTMDVEGAMGR